MIINKALSARHCLLLIVVSWFAPIKIAYSTTISGGTTTTSSLTDNFINFTGAGTLQVNNSYSLIGDITTSSSGVGSIDFSSTNTFIVGNSIVNGSIGISGTKIGNISFSSDGTLDIYGNIYATNITNNTTNTGKLRLDGTSFQVIDTTIGTISNRLKKIEANNASAGMNFIQDFYVKDFSATGVSNIASGKAGYISGDITGQGKIQSISDVNGQLVFDATTAQNISSQIGANGNRINLETKNVSGVNFTKDSYINDLTLTSGVANINSNSSMDIAGVISGSGVLQSSDQTGRVTFSGTTTQTVDSQIGSLSNKLSNITINNSNNGVTFSKDIFATTINPISNNTGKITFSNTTNAQNVNAAIGSGIVGSAITRFNNITINNTYGITFNDNLFVTDFTSTSGDSTIASGKTANISGTISGTGILKGPGNLTLDGSTAQTTSSNIGTAANKFSTITINNTDTSSGATFNGDIYSTNFVANGKTTINGSGTIDIGSTSVSNNNILNFINNAKVTGLSTGANSILSIADSKILNISGNVSGTGKIQSVNNLGNINFNGTSPQTVISNIGISTNKINNITVDTSNQDVSFAGDIYATNTNTSGKFIFNGSSAGQTIDSIISATNLSITNNNSAGVTFKQNVTASNNMVIDGNVISQNSISATNGITTSTNNTGFLTLSGSSNQTLNSTIGASDKKLNTITTSNTAGVLFQRDIYTTNFNASNGTATIDNNGVFNTTNLTIGSSAILDIKAANLNISGNTAALTSGTSTGKLQSSTKTGNVTFNGTTGAQNIAFQLGDINNRLNIITAYNANGVTFANDIYSGGLVIDQDVANLDTTITISGAVNLINNITTLDNDRGNLILNGTSNQTIGVEIGRDNSSVIKKLNSITVSNASGTGVTFSENVYTNNLAINGGNLTVKKSLNIGTGSINTSVNNTGKITFSGTTLQTVDAIITANNQRLSNITVSNSSGVAFNNDFFTNDFAASLGTSTIASNKVGHISGNITGTTTISGAASSNLTLDGTSTQTISATLGTAIVNVTNTSSGGIVFNGNINNTTTNILASADNANNVSFGNSITVNAQVGDAVKRFNIINVINGGATFNQNLYAKDFAVSSGATANINNSKIAYIYGSTSGSGILQSSDQSGNVIIGSASSLVSQSVGLTLGTSSNRLNSIDIANINGASFNQNAFTKNFSDSGAGLITINSSETMSVSEAASNTNKLRGSGTLSLDGTLAQNITSQIGVSNVDKLGTLKIANTTAGVTISGSNIYATNLVINGLLSTSSDLNVNSITTSIANGSLTLNKIFTVAGTEQIITPTVTSNSNRLGTLIVNSGTVANFSDNIFVKDITADGTINLSSSKTADVSGNISSTGTLQSLVGIITSGNGGNLTLSGTTQTISAKIGVLGNELNTITANNGTTANFTDNIFTNNIIATGTGGITIASGKTANVSGNITGAGSLKGLTDGVGDLLLKGKTQTISALIGASSNKLNKITVQSTSTSSFNKTVYTNDFDNLGTTIIGGGGDIHVAATLNGGGTLKGATNTVGTLTFDGLGAQSISSQIGVDNSNKLGNLKITNSSGAGVTLNTSNLFVNNLIIDGKLSSSVDLNVNSITSSNNTGILILNKGIAGTQNVTSTISSSSLETRLGTLTINNSTTANFSDNIAVKDITIATTADSINLAANKTAFIAGNLTGSGVLKGANTSSVTFDGNTPQTVSLQIGQDSSNKIGTLTIGTGASVTDTFDVNSSNLILAGSLTTSGALNVNTITNGASNTPVGSLILNGVTQTITPIIASNTNRLGTLAVNSGTTGNFSDNIFVKDIAADGTLNITSSKTFDVSGNITSAGTGILRGTGSGIIGNLIFSGSGGTIQTVTAKIGFDTNDKLDTITIGTSGAPSSVATNKDIYASNIISGNANSSLTLNSGATQTIDTAIADPNLSTNRLGNLVLNTSTIGNFTKNIYVKNINDSGTLNIASGQTIKVSGIVSGGGTLKSNNTSGIGGTLVFDGTSTQNISTAIGNNTYIGRMSLLKNNNNSSEVVFNNSAYTQDFTGSGSEVTNINGLGNIFVAGNITNTNKIRGSGTLTLDGSLANSGTSSFAQTISSQIGGSNTDRLGTVKIDNSLGATFNGNIYASNFNIANGTAIIAAGSSIVNIGNIDVASSTKLTVNNSASVSGNITGSGQFDGSGTLSLDGTSGQNVALVLGTSTSNRLGKVIANNSSTLGTTLVNDLFLADLTINGNLTITGQVDVTNNITGTGNLTLNGGSAQTINSQISNTGSRLNSLTIANSSGVDINQNTYVKDLTLSSGTANIAATKTIYISGNITGGSQLSGASGSVNLDGSSVQNISSKMGASVSRIGTLIVNNTSGTTFSNDIYTNNFTVNGKTTINAETTDLGAVTINSGELAFNNNATATSFVNNSGGGVTINAAKTVTTIGAATISSGSTLNIGITDLTSGHLNPNSATVANGANINFIYFPSSQIILDNAYTFLTTTTALTATPANLVLSDNSYLTKPVVNTSLDTKSLEMKAIMDNAAISDLNNGGATIVNNIVSTSSSSNDMSLLQNELLKISDKSDVESALSSLTETRSNMNQRVANNISNKITDIINSRLFDLNTVTTGFSSGNSGEKDSKGWGQAFAGVANQNSTGDKEGFKSNVSGAIVGYDYTVKNDDTNSVIGIAFGYSNAGVNSNSSSTSARSTNINSYQIALYNNNSAKTGLGLYNENIANLTINDYQSNRTIKVGGLNRNAKANFGGNGYSLKTGIGYNFNVSNAFLLAPNIALRYFKLSQNDYQETGAGDVGLKVSANSFETLASEVGVRIITKKINLDEYDVGNTPLDQYNILPEFKLAWLHNLKKGGQTYTTQFIGGGDLIKTTGFDLPSNIYNLGIELNFANKEDDSVLSFKYDLETGQGYTGHIGSIKYRMPF